MKLAFLLHQFFPRHHTGTEQYARALALEARRRGHDARVFTHEPSLSATTRGRERTDDVFEGIPVRRVAIARDAAANPVLAGYDSPLLSFEARRWMEEFRPDALHAFHLMGLGVSCLGDARALGIPALVHATDFWAACPIATLTLPDGTPCEGPPDGGLGCFGCIDRPVGEALAAAGLVGEVRSLAARAGALRHHAPLLPSLGMALVGRREEITARVSAAHAVIAPSKFLRDALARHGVAREKLALVPYGLDLTRLAGLKARRSGPVTFGFLGTIAPHKGVRVLVEAFARVKGELRLTIRGRAREFPEYGAAVEELARADSRVRLAGPFAPAELGDALSEIDVLVVPSLWHENIPFVVLEALAARRPVIASDRGGLSEALAGGTLVPAGDVDALAGALARFADRAKVEAAIAAIGAPRSVADAFDELERVLGGVRSARRD